MAEGFITKDSGQREEYASGMRRDTQENKPRFGLLRPRTIPYAAQFLTRCAELMMRGAQKYGERNWELADSQEELERFKESAERHMNQWLAGDTDEDHAAAVFFNINAAITTEYRITHGATKAAQDAKAAEALEILTELVHREPWVDSSDLKFRAEKLVGIEQAPASRFVYNGPVEILTS